ncbi:uncharacterized protein PG986_006392 [Apiospora aurea]|uniref:Uncharacterized protein n=1 Tax=Apiospora aurea TaxID=335848 RepID=A0ABR1QKA3_9PEZI
MDSSSSEYEGVAGAAHEVYSSDPDSDSDFSLGSNEDEDLNDQIEDKVKELGSLKRDGSEKKSMLEKLKAKLAKAQAGQAEQDAAIPKYQGLLGRASNISYGHRRDTEDTEKMMGDNEAEVDKQAQTIRKLEHQIEILRALLPTETQEPQPNPAKRNFDGRHDSHGLQRKRRHIRQKDEEVELAEPEFHTGEGWTRDTFAKKNGIIYAYAPVSEEAH